jgi:hypothetical protein
LTIERFEPGFEDRCVPYQSFGLLFTAYDEYSFDGCSDILDRAKTLLHRVQFLPTSGEGFIIYLRSTVMQDLDRAERQIFMLKHTYDVEFIG